MCSCDDFLEVYKEDVTFRIRTPESIDPKRTNPRALFVAAVADTVGSSSPVVARVLLQGRDILESAMFERPVDKAGVVRVLYAIKESLVVCEKVTRRVAAHIDGIVEKIRTVGLTPQKRGRALNPFPQVPDLETDAATFLVQAKRAIRSICELPSLFLPMKGNDTNFDKLLKTLSKTPSAPAPVVACVRDNATPIPYLTELRNCQEHPNAKKRTLIENFKLMPDNRISVPMWYVSGDPPQDVREDMLAAVEFLIQVTEVLLILLVIGTVTKNIPYVVVQVEDAKVDPKMPTKYLLSVDIAKMTAKSP
jgi:hypothetical protein